MVPECNLTVPGRKTQPAISLVHMDKLPNQDSNFSFIPLQSLSTYKPKLSLKNEN